MNVFVSVNPKELGEAAGAEAAEVIKNAIEHNGQAQIILATGTSQFETLEALIRDKSIDWSKVVMFHLDEYIGLPETHAASFRKYLKERFLAKVPSLKAVYLINGDTDPEEECERLNKLIAAHDIDLAMVGIGENGHLAFNDPPADFETSTPYLIVELEEKCRQQQFNEGWFRQVSDVPRSAISMSVKQIMKSRTIICSVPNKRKAQAVRDSLEEKISPMIPASILQKHPQCSCYLDQASAELLSKEYVDKLAV